MLAPFDVESTISAAVPEVFRALDLTGVIINGFLGGRLARQKGFDAVGFLVLAIMSALGGGIVRDVMLQAGPPVALTDPYYLIIAVVGAGLAMLWRFDGRWARRGLLLADGMVLGAWAATGVTKALTLDFGVVPALLMGMMTAIGGGMIRDITAGNVPMVFGGNYLYATPAFVAAIIDLVLYKADLPLIGMIAATIISTCFVVISRWRRWTLPQNWEWSISMTPKQWRKNRAVRMERKRRFRRKYFPNMPAPAPVAFREYADPEADTPGNGEESVGNSGS